MASVVGGGGTERVCNGDIIRLNSTTEETISFLHGKNDQFRLCNQDTLKKKVEELVRNHKNLKSRKMTKKLNELSERTFGVPGQNASRSQTLTATQTSSTQHNQTVCSQKISELKESVELTETVMREVTAQHTEVMNTAFLESKALKRKCAKLESVAKKSKKDCDLMNKKYESLVEKKKCLVAKHRNDKKIIKRRDTSIKVLEEENFVLTNKIDNTPTNLTVELESLKQERLKLISSKSSLKFRMKQLITKREKDVKLLKEKNSEQKKDIDNLEQMLNFLEGESVPKNISAKCDGKYTDTVREACMILLAECNVNFKHLPKAVDVILSKIGGISIDRMPSAGTLHQIMTEAGIIASAHVGAQMMKDFDPTASTGNVLHQDATTKFHKHYEGLQVTLKEGATLSMGLHQVAGGSTEDYRQSFHDTLNDIASAYDPANKKETKDKLHASFKAFMNDKAAVNKSLTTVLEEERRSLLPTVIDNYDSIPEAQKSDIESMGHFSCRLHLLSNLGPAAEKGLASFEDAVAVGTNPDAFSEEHCGSCRLVRTSAKAFTERGDDKSGVAHYFESFLEGNKNHIVPFQGHRFNILFYDAAAVYFHSKQIKQFLSAWPNPNRLLKCVKFDVKQAIYLAGARALGVIFKLLTGPFQTLLATNMPVLHLNPHLMTIQKTLKSWAKNAGDVLSGEGIHANFVVHKDEIYDCLFTPDPATDALTILAVEQIAAEMLILFERQASEQLPGGDHSQPDKSMSQLASNVPCTNVISERDMAKLDTMVRKKPSAKIGHLETCIMAQSNQPSKWLESLDEETKGKRLSQARKGASATLKNLQARHENIKSEISRRLASKQREKAQQEEKQQANKLSVVKNLQSMGGLWDVEDIPSKLLNISQAEAKKSIMNQLKFYKMVLNVKGPKNLFQESSGGEPYSVERLTENLISVISLTSSSSGSNNISEAPGITMRDNYMEEISKRKKTAFTTLKDARNSRTAKQQQSKLLPELLQHPDALISKEVLHKCKEDGVVEWFRGRVVNIMKRTKDNLRTEFEIRYDGTPETWSFPLLIDMRNGDLITL